MINYDVVLDRFRKFTLKNRRVPDENYIEEIMPDTFTPDVNVKGVYYKIIGTPKVIYTAHYDTAGDSDVELVSYADMPHIVKNNAVGILGADDKAGLTVLSFMIEASIEGLYMLFGDEESGASQSTKWADSGFYTRYGLVENSIVAAIAFDRKGYSDVIYSQRGGTTCSKKYSATLATILAAGGLSYRPSTGVYTDTANMIHIIPECTNLSIGYQDAHTHTENQDMMFLFRMVNFMLNNYATIASIPAFKEVEVKKTYTYYGGGWGGHDYKRSGYSTFSSKKEDKIRWNSKESHWERFDEDRYLWIQVDYDPMTQRYTDTFVEKKKTQGKQDIPNGNKQVYTKTMTDTSITSVGTDKTVNDIRTRIHSNPNVNIIDISGYSVMGSYISEYVETMAQYTDEFAEDAEAWITTGLIHGTSPLIYCNAGNVEFIMSELITIAMQDGTAIDLNLRADFFAFIATVYAAVMINKQTVIIDACGETAIEDIVYSGGLAPYVYTQVFSQYQDVYCEQNGDAGTAGIVSEVIDEQKGDPFTVDDKEDDSVLEEVFIV